MHAVWTQLSLMQSHFARCMHALQWTQFEPTPFHAAAVHAVWTQHLYVKIYVTNFPAVAHLCAPQPALSKKKKKKKKKKPFGPGSKIKAILLTKNANCISTWNVISYYIYFFYPGPNRIYIIIYIYITHIYIYIYIMVCAP